MIKLFNFNKNKNYINYITTHLPNAISQIKGNAKNPTINGTVEFYQLKNGVLVISQIFNLPQNSTGDFFAMHIHEANNCNENENGDFEDSKHFSKKEFLHPSHSGDLPVIQANSENGEAFSVNLTNRFFVSDIIGKTIFIHENADDFRTDPSGNSGKKIACGVIKKP